MRQIISTTLFFLLALSLTIPAAAGQYDELKYPGRPSDEDLISWMKVPVLKTLSHVDYELVDDSTYESKVVKGSGACMLAILSDDPEGTQRNGSRGMAALLRALKTMHPSVKLFVYMVNDKGRLTIDEFNHLRDTYEIRNVPALLFFSDFGGYGEKERHMTTFERSIIWDGDLLISVDHYGRDYFPNYMFKE